jgi:uncharacterized BrkB/YihY/UPF0761 family membrane protein
MNLKKHISNIFLYLKKVFQEFSADNILKYSASLAYYTVFSIAPLLLIVTALLGLFFGKEAMQGQIYQQLSHLVGSVAALQIQDTIKNKAEKSLVEVDYYPVAFILINPKHWRYTYNFAFIKCAFECVWGFNIKLPKKLQ